MGLPPPSSQTGCALLLLGSLGLLLLPCAFLPCPHPLLLGLRIRLDAAPQSLGVVQDLIALSSGECSAPGLLHYRFLWEFRQRSARTRNDSDAPEKVVQALFAWLRMLG